VTVVGDAQSVSVSDVGNSEQMRMSTFFSISFCEQIGNSFVGGLSKVAIQCKSSILQRRATISFKQRFFNSPMDPSQVFSKRLGSQKRVRGSKISRTN